MSEYEYGVFGHNRIRIAVLPVGNISATAFKFFVSKIQEFETINTHSLSRFTEDITKSPFKKHNWNQGKLSFQFVDGLNASQPVLELFQHKRIHAVLGIIDCSVEDDINMVYSKFTKIYETFQPQASLGWCFAFEPQEHQNFDHVKDFMIFPNQRDRITDYIEVQIYNLALELLKEFEKRAHDPKLLKGFSTTNIESKYFGEYALLSGAFQDASYAFTTAIEVGKLNHASPITVATCIQGLACAQAHSKSNTFTKNAELCKLMHDAYMEAITIYETKGMFDLQVESLLKLAHMYATCEIWSKRVQTMTLVSLAVQKSEKFPIAERIVILGDAARLVLMVGAKRKFAAYLMEMAQIYRSMKKDEIGYYYLSSIPNCFHLTLERTEMMWKWKHEEISGWKSIQLNLLKELLTSSFKVDEFASIQLITFLLVYYLDILSETEQQEYYEKLKDHLKLKSTPFDCFVPLIHHMEPQKVSPHLIQLKEPKESTTKSLFYYNPFDKVEKANELVYAKGDFVKIKISFHNKFAFDIHIKNFSIITSNSDPHTVLEQDVNETKLCLPANSKTYHFIVIRPNHSGILTVIGSRFVVEEFHCVSEYIMKKQDQFSIEITEPLPLLDFTVENRIVSLYHGEKMVIKSILKNNGNLTIDHIHIDVINLSQCNITMYQTDIKKHLPLAVGSSFEFYFEIFGIAGEEQASNNLDIKIKYRHGTEWYRLITFPMKIHTSPGVLLKSVKKVDLVNQDPLKVALLVNQSDSRFIVYNETQSFEIGRHSSKLLPFDAQSLKWKTVSGRSGVLMSTLDESTCNSSIHVQVTSEEKKFVDPHLIQGKLGKVVSIAQSVKTLGEKNIKIDTNIMMEVEDGKLRLVTPDQLFYNGKLAHHLKSLEENVIQIYPFIEGVYQIQSKITDDSQSCYQVFKLEITQ